MKRAGNRRKGLLPERGSLRIQLLSRSLLILAVLLILIGLFQYVVMKNFIYKNKAETMQRQVMSIPRDLLQGDAQQDRMPQGGTGQGSGMPGEAGVGVGQSGEAGQADGQQDNAGQISGQTSPGTGGNPQGGRRQPWVFPDSAIVHVGAEGQFTVLSKWPGSGEPPQLDAAIYTDAMKRKGLGTNYRVAADSAGVEQLVVLQSVPSGPGRTEGLMQISTPTGPMKEVLIRQLLTFLLLSVLAMAFGLLGFLPVLRRTLVPLNNMVGTVEQIDAGNLATRFPAYQGQHEIDRLAESFNGMLERLETSFEAEKELQEGMRRFVADASHELRTPLTSIHGFLEVLLRGAAQQPEQLDKALRSMHGESARMNKLVNDLLQLAKLDRTPHIELKEGSLDRVVREMEPQLRLLAGARQLELVLEPELRSAYDADKMKQVILNLFHNAVQHTVEEQGRIRIIAESSQEGVHLSVEDNGPGIAAEHLPLLFDRFYRSDSSRTRKYGGAGLGLAITKSIVDAHGGTIAVFSVEGEGSTFKVTLPKP
ncbi:MULTISPECIES: sensor histidine kinase [Paenibacillus]|uniref:sensor histidine kinase n=1 Tax=Paenibacillus TaxID=44249 RepID=UPI0022B923EC|nr:HAMP domain-containing sensor histidine kinase [Paenibacillus caseinilyticus]MCZ8522111.1 HAMP domain-containing sensor histidine kinase [Paenibacillus caseinilyticus]